jgi:hypothetical protein
MTILFHIEVHWRRASDVGRYARLHRMMKTLCSILLLTLLAACDEPSTRERATLLARQLANKQAEATYNCKPFVGGPSALWTNGHWVWRERRAVGSGDIEAAVSLAPDLSTQSVQVLLLDNRVKLPASVPGLPDTRIIEKP